MAGNVIGVYPSRIDPRSRIKDAKEFMESGKVAITKSTWVRRIWYVKEKKDLYVEFKKGALGYYHGVAERVVIDFYNARSMGKFVHTQLKNNFNFTVIRKR